jgi:PST family polysaccharide transporter
VIVTQEDEVYPKLAEVVANHIDSMGANARTGTSVVTHDGVLLGERMTNRPQAVHECESSPEDPVAVFAGICSDDSSVPSLASVSGMAWFSVSRHLKSRLFTNFLSIATLQAATFLVPLILIPYLLHSLGASNFGLLMFAQAFAQFLTIIVNYGHDFSATQQIAIHRDDVPAISKIFCATLVVRLILLSCALLVAAALVLSLPPFRVHWPIYFITFLGPTGAAISPTWFYQGMEKLPYLMRLSLIARVAALACTIAFVHSENDYVLAAIIESARVAIAGLAALALAWRVAPLTLALPTYSALRDSLRNGWHFYVAIICSSVYSVSTVLVLGLLAGNAAVGYYSLAEKPIRAAIALTVLSMSAVVFPRITSLVHQSVHDAATFLRRLICVGGGVGLAMSCAIFLARGPLLRLLFGESVAPSITALGYLAWLPFLVMMNNILSIQTMVPFGMSRLVSRILFVAAALHIVLLVPLAYYIGAVGASIAVLLTDLFMPVCMAVILARKGLLPVSGGKYCLRLSRGDMA